MPEIDFDDLNGAQLGVIIDAIRLTFDEDQLAMLLLVRST